MARFYHDQVGCVIKKQKVCEMSSFKRAEQKLIDELQERVKL